MKNNIDRRIYDPDNYKFGLFYYNPKDKRIFVPKQDNYRGWTINFGNVFSYILLIAVVLIILSYKFLF